MTKSGPDENNTFVGIQMSSNNFNYIVLNNIGILVKRENLKLLFCFAAKQA